MKLSMSMSCKQSIQPPVRLNMEPFYRRKDKVVFVMGATGTGKSRLAIDLATRFPAEIINSDKIQVYKGLDIATNKVTEEECQGVPHHLLGIIEPDSSFTSTDFRNHAKSSIETILGRDRVPIIAGGSNSYIEALVKEDVEFRSRYECCFLWVDVSLPVLHSSVSERVDRMVQLGLIDEVRKFFDPRADFSRGIRRAIGVPELDHFLRAEQAMLDEKILVKFLEVAIQEIKENNCVLASRQLQKIHRLYSQWKWNKMHRIDATEVFLKHGQEADEVWEKHVARRGFKIIDQFLHDEDRCMSTILSPDAPSPFISISPVHVAAMATAAR